MENKEIEEKLTVLEQAIVNLKIESFDTTFKFESLLRNSVQKNLITLDEFIDSVIEHTKLQNKLKELKTQPELLERVKLAASYNSLPETRFHIYADDLLLRQQIEAAGGCLPHVAKEILQSLPISNSLKIYFEQFLTVKDNA